jgi:hypothetical protein
MNLLAFIEIGSFRIRLLVTKASLAAGPSEGIGGTGRPAVPLTAVREFLLAGSRAGRWRRRRDRAEA